jgi:glutaredoxin-related protein
MSYLIEISETSPKAKSIINMLKMLSLDYDFMQITKTDDNLDFMTTSQKEEFEKRYNYTINNMEEGKTWEEIEQKLLS